jgi:hypothetical protein
MYSIALYIDTYGDEDYDITDGVDTYYTDTCHLKTIKNILFLKGITYKDYVVEYNGVLRAQIDEDTFNILMKYV